MVTLDKRTGMVDWRIDDIGSPIVALFRLDGDGIISTPMTSVSQETLSKLISHFDEDPNVQPKKPKKVNKLFSTLYVGEHEHGLFAMPSLVDQETLTISPGSNGPLLLEGPKNFKMPQNGEITLNGITDSDKGGNNDPFGIPREPDRGVNEGSVLLFGYYQVPKHTSIRLTPAIGSLQLIGKNPSRTFEHGKYIEKITPEPLFPPPSKELLEYKQTPEDQDTEQENRTQPNPIPEAYDSVVIGQGFDALKTFNMTFILSKDMFKFAKELVKWSSTIHNIELKIIIVILCIGVYILYNFLMKNASHSIYSFGSFRNSSRMSNGSRGKGNYEVTALPYELEDGNIKVGNVIFDPTCILGKGCEGTFVYK